MRDEIIKVYSSCEELITSFDKNTVDNAENRKEKIYNPHVTIDEDNSTATFEIFKDSQIWQSISSESVIYEIDGRRYFIYGEPSQISDDNLIRVTLKEIWNELDTKYVQAYNVKGDLEYIAEYTVSLVPFGDYPLIVNGVTRTNSFTRDNLGYYIWALLQDTGYSITYCDVDSTYDEVNLLSAYQLETEGLTVLENLKQLKELTDCIFKWDTINKTLAVYDRNLANSEQNKWQGYEIREGVNLKSIEKRKNTNITTRVIPYGSDNLTIASVNEDLLYLTDTSYSNKIYTKIINNPDIESPQVLKSWAEKELNKMCRPTVEYEVDFVKRTDCEYAVESFNLYDIVRVVYFDKELGQEVVDNQRIISLDYDVWKESAFVAKLGDKHMRWEQKLKQAIQDGKRSGQVISSSGIISAGNIVYGTGINKRRIDTVVAEIDAKADENGAYVNLLALYANDTQGIKSAPTDTDKTEWNTSYTYYAIDSQKFYKYNSSTSAWEETKPINASLAQITATADADRAEINSLAEWQSSDKNLFDVQHFVNTIDKYKITNGNLIANISDGSAWSEMPLIVTVEPNTQYTLSVANACEIQVGDTTSIIATTEVDANTLTFTTTSTGKLTFKFAANKTMPFNVGKVQLEKGGEATSYAPFGGAERSIANVTQKADANGASIGLVASWKSGVESDVASIASISLKANANESAILLKADKTVVDGVLVITDGLSDGTTVVKGNCVQTGYIKSETYSPPISGNFSTDGMQISLDGKGCIRSKNFAIDSSGDAYLKGNVIANSGRIADWIIESDYIASYDEDSDESNEFYINSYSNSSDNWIEALNSDGEVVFSVSKSGSAYLRGYVEATSGRIGSNISEAWYIGTSGLYYGINALDDTSYINGIYIGTDGVKNRNITTTVYPTFTIHEQDDVFLGDGYAKFSYKRERVGGGVGGSNSLGYLKSNELFLNETYDALFKGIRLSVRGFDADSVGHLEYCYGSTSNYTCYDVMTFSGTSTTLWGNIYLENLSIDDGSGNYDLASLLNSFNNRIEALEQT